MTQSPELKQVRRQETDNPVCCKDCGTVFTSSDQYSALTNGRGQTKYWCAPGYGCREWKRRHDDD